MEIKVHDPGRTESKGKQVSRWLLSIYCMTAVVNNLLNDGGSCNLYLLSGLLSLFTVLDYITFLEQDAL